MALFTLLRRHSGRRLRAARQVKFESLELRNMPAVLLDVGHHFVEPNTSGQTVSLSVVSTSLNDPAVAGFDLRAQIVTAKDGPKFQGVRFAGDLWNSFPHIESGSPFPTIPTLASGDVAFTQGFEARANRTVVTFTIDTTGIPAGSYEFRLVGTQIGSSHFRRANGSGISEVITNGTLQVRSIWQNPDNPYDINGDGRVSPLDVLLILSTLNKQGSRELTMPSSGEEPESFFDVDGDGYLSPKDPLGIINCLNGLGCVTTPAPILARVTPDFKLGSPDATDGDKPVPDESEDTNALPTEDVEPDDPACTYYEADGELFPATGTDPDGCEPSYHIEPAPLLADPAVHEAMLPDSTPVIEQTTEEPTAGLPAYRLATVLPASSVDAAIRDLADDDTSDALIEAWLLELLASA